MTRVLVVSNDRVGTRMAGAAIRSWEIAHQLARDADVVLGVPLPTDVSSETVDVRVLPESERALATLAASFDAVFAQWLPPLVMARLARSQTRTVYDLYDPVLLENLALQAGHDEGARLRLNVRATNLVQQIALTTGDAFVCASERQRDLWLGFLAALGRIDEQAFERDPTLRQLIDVVPFGLPGTTPVGGGPVLKGVHPQIADGDRVVLWGGGIWDWLDPFTVIRAVEALERPDVKLVFLGAGRPHPGMRPMPVAAEARALAGPQVVFNDGWVPYEERASYLLESDVGVSAHADHVEARFAFRTRILDYVWAGLPLVATRGDELAELVASRGGGRVVPEQDVAAFARALDEQLARGRSDDHELRERLSWERVVQPLASLLRQPTIAGRRPVARALTEHTLIRARLSFAHRGALGAVARLRRRA